MGDLSGSPDNLSYVNLQLISLDPGHLAALAPLGRGAPASLALHKKGRAASAIILRAETCAQGLPKLKAVSSPVSSTFKSNGS